MDEISKQLASIIADYVATDHLTLGRISSSSVLRRQSLRKRFSNSPFGMDDAAHAKGTAQDQRVASEFLSGQIDTTKIRMLTSALKDIVWCGRYSIPFGMLTANKVAALTTHSVLRGNILRYSDTYSEGTVPVTKTGMGTTAIFSLEHWSVSSRLYIHSTSSAQACSLTTPAKQIFYFILFACSPSVTPKRQ